MGSQLIQILREGVCLGGNRDRILTRGRQAKSQAYIVLFVLLRSAAADDPKEVTEARSEPLMAEAGGTQLAAAFFLRLPSATGDDLKQGTLARSRAVHYRRGWDTACRSPWPFALRLQRQGL